MTDSDFSISELEREAQEALEKINSERGTLLMLKAVEPWTEPKNMAGFYNLRLVGDQEVAIRWLQGRETFGQAVYEAVERDLSRED